MGSTSGWVCMLCASQPSSWCTEGLTILQQRLDGWEPGTPVVPPTFLLLWALQYLKALTLCSEQPRIRQRLSPASVCYVFCLWQVQELSYTGKRKADERHPWAPFDSQPPSKAPGPSPLTLSCLSPSPTELGVSSPIPQLQETLLATPTPRTWASGKDPRRGEGRHQKKPGRRIVQRQS